MSHKTPVLSDKQQSAQDERHVTALEARLSDAEEKIRDLVRHLGDRPPPVAEASRRLRFPPDYDPGGAEVRKTYKKRIESGFFDAYLGGEVVLDIGFKGQGNPENKTVVPHAVGVDLDYPGYDGKTLPFSDDSVDCVFSSHSLEHFWFPQEAIRDQFRVLKNGGFLVCIVPDKFLYEKRSFPPSIFNPDHKRFFTPGSLLTMFEEALVPNSYRVRHLSENDFEFDYSIGPAEHSRGCYEIECVLEKIALPTWVLS